eukprot:gene12333-6006_t
MMKQTKNVLTKNFRSYKKWTKWEINSVPYQNPLDDKTQDVIHVVMNTNKVNAFSSEFLSDLHGALDVLKHDFPPESPVTFRSHNSCFAAGMDVKYVNQDLNEVTTKEYITSINNALERLYLLNPIVNGHAIAGGLVLALACDFRVMSTEKNSLLSLKTIQLGLNLPSIPMVIAKAQVSSPEPLYEALFTGKNYSADEAYDAGLLTRVVDQDSELEGIACDLLTETDCKNSLAPFQIMKKHLKEPAIVEMRESGEAKKLDSALLKQLIDPNIKQLIERSLPNKK